MKRIICHWSAGGYKATAPDRKHYHYIFEGDGAEVRGNFAIEANRHPVKGKYAAHTLRCNSGSIGLSMACMRGAVERPLDYGPSPMTMAQWDAMCRKAAQLCLLYDIPVTAKTVLSHAEVQGNLGIKQRGKWDFTVLPFAPKLKGARACGDRLRADVQSEIRKLQSPSYETQILTAPLAPAGTRARLEQSHDIAEATHHLRKCGSRTVKSGDMLQTLSTAGGTATAGVYAVSEFTTALEMLPDWLWPLPGWALLLLLIAGLIAVFWYARTIKIARAQDHVSGLHRGRPEIPDEYYGENV